MDLGLQGKWALVCGASRGLGWGCARALALEGVNVLMVARRADVLQEAADAIRAERGQDPAAEVVVCAQDITTEAGRAAVFATRSDFDIVVTNAGGPPSGNFRDWEREDWIRAVDANMLTPIALIKATVDAMAERGYGRIINITSSAVKAPIDLLGLSNGARSGLTGFVAGLARSGIAAQGVTVNNLLPGACLLQPRKNPGKAWTPWPHNAVRAFRHSASARQRNLEPFAPFCAAPRQATSPGKTCWSMAGRFPGRFKPWDQRLDDNRMPDTISTKAAAWKACGGSPKKAADSKAAKNGVRFMKNPARVGPAKATPAPQER